jgi:hypothetical protein
MVAGLFACVLAVGAVAPRAASATQTNAAAQARVASYDPATQSHPGACSLETERVATAVSDYERNGVLAGFAHLVGIHGSQKAIAKAMRRDLAVETVARTAVTENHGCGGEGDWFAVGPRTLVTGERVAVRLPAKVHDHLCTRGSSRCRRELLNLRVVFPTNCWNPNFGKVQVAVYVRQHKPKHKVKAAKESLQPTPPETATPTPTTTPASPVTPAPVPAATVPAPAPAPAASATLSCSTGGVLITISNGTSATQAASFTVDGVVHGPLAAGASETIAVPLNPGASAKIVVDSGAAVLLEETIVNTCAAAPHATLAVRCEIGAEGEEVFDGEAEAVVTVEDESKATLPASFEVEWPGFAIGYTEDGEPIREAQSHALGPLSPGTNETYVFYVEAYGEPQTIEVSSGGRVILEETVSPFCAEVG